MASQIAARYAPSAAPAAFAPTRAVNDARYLIVPCEAEGCGDLAVIWDLLEEQVVDVIDAAAGRYTDEDALWDEFKAETFRPARPSRQWRAAA